MQSPSGLERPPSTSTQLHLFHDTVASCSCRLGHIAQIVALVKAKAAEGNGLCFS
jgi:hypothetical protein